MSPDSPKSHTKFKQKYNLPYTLMADENHAIAEAYGVWGEKMNYGRKYMGVLRTTYIIDPDGRVAQVFEKVKPENHAEQVMEALNVLSKSGRSR